jgi:hypothetical protein
VSVASELHRARRVHESIDPALRGQPLRVRPPAAWPLYAPVTLRKQTEDERRAEHELRAAFGPAGVARGGVLLDAHDIPAYGAARRVIDWGFPYFGGPLDDPARLLYESMRADAEEESWRRDPNHAELLRLLAAGEVPDDRGDHPGPEPRSVGEAYAAARARGHRVPDDYIRAQRASYGEREAFYAAHYFFKFKDVGSHTTGRSRSALMSVQSNFPVPSPRWPGGAPYLLDVLFVALCYGPRVRLVAVEVDGEYHLSEEARRRDAERDAALASLGYEVWRVPGWWCRVDGWRVIEEVLVEAGLFDAGRTVFSRIPARTIDEYVCALCGEPMVRFDCDWIQRVEERRHGRDGYAHMECQEAAA